MILNEGLIKARCKSEHFSYIKTLNICGMNIMDVSILPYLQNLEVVSLSVNEIKTLQPFSYLPNLQELYLRNNKISDLEEVDYLIPLKKLKVLWLSNNPIASHPQYRSYIMNTLPQLSCLDSNQASTPAKTNPPPVKSPPQNEFSHPPPQNDRKQFRQSINFENERKEHASDMSPSTYQERRMAHKMSYQKSQPHFPEEEEELRFSKNYATRPKATTDYHQLYLSSQQFNEHQLQKPPQRSPKKEPLRYKPLKRSPPKTKREERSPVKKRQEESPILKKYTNASPQRIPSDSSPEVYMHRDSIEKPIKKEKPNEKHSVQNETIMTAIFVLLENLPNQELGIIREECSRLLKKG